MNNSAKEISRIENWQNEEENFTRLNEGLFPKLPLLLKMKDHFSDVVISKDTLFICAQHLTQTTGSLVSTILDMGAKEDNIYILGKNYSTDYDVLKKLESIGINVSSVSKDLVPGTFKDEVESQISDLWLNVGSKVRSSNISKIIILDDGGRCIAQIPTFLHKLVDIVSIEQTTKGTRNLRVINANFPVVSVATSAVKKIIESPIITKAVLSSAEQALNGIDINLVYGVIGLGNLGNSLANRLEKAGVKVLKFDRSVKDLNSSSNVETIDDLILNSDVIFGTTGTELDFDLCSVDKTEKTFISCSSEDIEFRKILTNFEFEEFGNINSLPDLVFDNNNTRISVLHGGYPVNFRNGVEVEPISKIQLTRALLFSAIMQSIELLNSNSDECGLVMLRPKYQQLIVDLLADIHSEDYFELPIGLFDKFSSTMWVQDNS